MIGPNGAGKTTLFKMIVGQEMPDGGKLTVGPTVKPAYVDQSRASLDDTKTLFEEVTGGTDHILLGGKKVSSRAYCARFNFRGPDQQKLVGSCSGGERNRIHLAKLLRSGGNMLLLDEPTNDLDVDTLRALEEALSNFGGCAVVISHDRWFLDRLATHILAFEGDSKVHWCEGNFQVYEEQRRGAAGCRGRPAAPGQVPQADGVTHGGDMATPFGGFGADALPFLRGLGEHQTKVWFDAHRATYEEHLKAPLGQLVEHLAAAFAKKKVPLTGTAAGSTFRMNRDVRFSKDKSPYKTNVSAVLSRTGAKQADGILYVHVDPAGSFLAAGFYQPEPPSLFALRSAVRDDPTGFRKVIAALAKKNLALDPEGSLKRLPKGFEDVAGEDVQAAVRLKSFVVSRPVPADVVASPGLADAAGALAADALPLLKFGWAAIDGLGGEPAPKGRR